MIRVFFSLSLLFLVIQSSYSQTFYAGPRAGFNLSRIDGFNSKEYRSGWAIGAFMMYKPCERIGFSSDLLLSAKGARVKKSYVTDTSTETWDNFINLNYLELPLLINLYFCTKNKIFKPRIFAGPTFGLKLSATENINYTREQDGILTEKSLKNKVSGNYKNGDLAFTFGAGFSYQMAERACFYLDARYTSGILDLRTINYYPSVLYNRNLSFLLGIGYQIGK
jgi:hypothetical protein